MEGELLKSSILYTWSTVALAHMRRQKRETLHFMTDVLRVFPTGLEPHMKTGMFERYTTHAHWACTIVATQPLTSINSLE